MSPHSSVKGGRRLRRFLLRRAFWAITLTVLGVTLLGQAIELLDRSGALARSTLSLWGWNLERLPLLFGLLLPVGTGLGAALYGGLLRLRGEYTALRALGIPPFRVVWTPIPLIVVLVGVQALCLEWGRPRAEAMRHSLREAQEAKAELLWMAPGIRQPVLITLETPGRETPGRETPGRETPGRETPDSAGCWAHTQLIPLNAQGLPSARIVLTGVCPTPHGWRARTQTLAWSTGIALAEWPSLMPPPGALLLLRQGSAEGLSTTQVLTLLWQLEPAQALRTRLLKTAGGRLAELLSPLLLWVLCTLIGLSGPTQIRLSIPLTRALALVTLVMALRYVLGG